MAGKTQEIVTIKPIEMKTVEITIEGDSPLIMHAWSEKAKLMMLEAQQGKAKGKARRDTAGEARLGKVRHGRVGCGEASQVSRTKIAGWVGRNKGVNYD